jgi:hypothetical protein
VATIHYAHGFSLGAVNNPPTAIITPATQEVVVSSIVRLDGRASTDPEGNALTYTWAFTQVPIGSQVESAGFILLETDGSVVTFAPDITGHYVISLVVNDGALDSTPALADIDTLVIMVPHNQGIIPDASFIWNYISDFWKVVEDRQKIETVWSSAIQLVASELLRLYQIDYNKSIKDIQELFQYRWLPYEPHLALDKTKTSFILADDQAGLLASTVLINTDSGIPEAVQPTYSTLVTVPLTEGSFTEAAYGQDIAIGRILKVSNRSFTMARAGELSSALLYGVDGATDGIGGTEFIGSRFTADMVGARLIILSGTMIGLELTIDAVTSDHTMDVLIGGVAYPWPVLETALTYAILPATVNSGAFFSDQVNVPTNLINAPWRFSSTLISSEYDFEDEGVCPGDVLEVEVARPDLDIVGTFLVQIIGVDRNKLSFVFNTDDLVDGVAAGGLSDDTQIACAQGLRILGLVQNAIGTLSYTDQAKDIYDTITSTAFKREYFETELTPDDTIDIGPFVITLSALKVIRNKSVPVNEKIVSAPVLQEFIKQPELSTADDGTVVQISGSSRYELDRAPVLLV